MPVVTLNFTGIGAATPATPPAGWLQLGSQQAKTDNTYFATNGVAQACWYYNTQLTGGLVKVKTQVGLVATLSSNRHGPFIINGTTGVGIQLWQSSATQLKISAISSAGNLTGADLHVITVPTLTDNCIFELWHTPSTGSTQIAINGVAQGAPYAGATIANLMGGCYCFSTNFLRGLRNASLDYGASVDTITDPITVGGAVSWTDTFSLDVASIAAAGTSLTSINPTAKTAVFPDFFDGQLLTVSLPSTDTSFVFTDTGGNTASILSDIDLPADYAVQTFYSAVSDDPHYLGSHTEILDGFELYYPTDNGLTFDTYGRIHCDSSMTVTVYKRKKAPNGDDTLVAVALTLSAAVAVGVINSVGTVRIGGTTDVTVSDFDSAVNAGTLDGVALTAASDTSITVPALADGENVPRPGTRELELTDGTAVGAVDVVVNPPIGWSSYVITGDFVEAINGVGSDYLPDGWVVTDFILSPNVPSSGKTTTVTDSGVVTNNVGTQELFLVDAATGLATAFDIVTTSGAESTGTGSSDGPTMQVVKMETLSMVGI